MFYRIPILGSLSLQPEVNFVRRPLRGTYSWDTYNALDPHVILDYSADQNIWELGAILHQEFGEGRLRPFAGGGLFAGFLTDKKVTYTRAGAPYSTSAFRGNDVSVLLESGLGMQIAENLSFALGLRYSIGFNQHGASPLSNSRIGAKFHRFLFNAGIARSF